jgi:imidazolonepropionase-like amidohydrolase
MVFAIRAARLFDGVGPQVVEQPVLVVDDGRIIEVRAGGSMPDSAEVVDLDGATLLPGLVDPHVHLIFDASPDPLARLSTATDDELLEGMRAAARTALAAGITTIRDLGDRDYLALRLRDEVAGDPTYPQILAAGPPITTTRGHCWFLGGEADGIDGVRAAVRAHAQRGVDVIKVMATGGEMTPGTHAHVSQFTVDELRAATDEAHRYGLPITAHAHGPEGIANVVAAGFDSVEHCSFFTETGVQADPEVLAALVKSGLVVSATLGLRPGSTPPPRIAARLAAVAEVFRQLIASGVTIVCGSDAGIGPGKPHDALRYAAADMVNMLGLSPVEALRAVTSTPAQVCGLGDRKGRLAPGYDADILAVAGDPLVDPTAMRNVAAVFRGGERVR